MNYLNKNAALWNVLLICSAAFYSCTYDVAETRPCDRIETDPVSFQGDMLPMFRTHCSTVGCHSGTVPAGGLDLTDSVAYAQLMQPGKGYVNLAKPEFSLLYIQMNSVSNPMPPVGRLDDCTLALVLDWIKQGAKNN